MGCPIVFYNNINGRRARSGEQTFYAADGHTHIRTEKHSPDPDQDPGYHIAMNFEGKLPRTIAAIQAEIANKNGPAHFEQFIILRDPLNTLASCARHFRPLKRSKNCIKFYEQTLAFQGLVAEAQAPAYLAPDKLIAYNRWLCDADYRRQLAGDLGMARVPERPGAVSHYGGGSSFSGHTLDDSDALLSRWREMADDPLFLSLFCDARLVQDLKAYATLFGDNYAPGADAFDELMAKAGANEQAYVYYHKWLVPLRANPEKRAAVQLATGTPGYIPAKLRLRLALGLHGLT